MATKRQIGGKRRKGSRAPKTLNQFANAARRKTRALRDEAETAVEKAGKWVGGGMKRRPWMVAAFATAVGVIGLVAGRNMFLTGLQRTPHIT